MVKYEYNVDVEGFRRVDNRGKTLPINIIEARRIIALKNLGYSVQKIYNEMELNKKISITTLRTFINNYKEGNISIEGDYPAPKKVMDEMALEERVAALERKLKECEEKRKESDKGFWQRLRDKYG